MFFVAARVERSLRGNLLGRALLLIFAIASPVDLVLDFRAGTAFVDEETVSRGAARDGFPVYLSVSGLKASENGFESLQ